MSGVKGCPKCPGLMDEPSVQLMAIVDLVLSVHCMYFTYPHFKVAEVFSIISVADFTGFIQCLFVICY